MPQKGTKDDAKRSELQDKRKQEGRWPKKNDQSSREISRTRQICSGLLVESKEEKTAREKNDMAFLGGSQGLGGACRRKKKCVCPRVNKNVTTKVAGYQKRPRGERRTIEGRGKR